MTLEEFEANVLRQLARMEEQITGIRRHQDETDRALASHQEKTASALSEAMEIAHHIREANIRRDGHFATMEAKMKAMTFILATIATTFIGTVVAAAASWVLNGGLAATP